MEFLGGRKCLKKVQFCDGIQMLKRIFVIFAVIYCLGKRNCSCAATSVARKNVLMIMVDDLRPAIRAAGDKNAITPNIDKLLNRSFYFKNAFAQQSLCAPSRNSILTSRRPDTLRLYDFHSYWRDVAGNFTTFPQYFRENGYFTYSIGKVFHPGESSNNTDDFPASWSLPTFHAETEEFLNSPFCVDRDTGEFTNNLLCAVDLNLVPFGTLPDMENTEKAIEMLQKSYENASESPFFIAIGYHKPHIPFMFPLEYLRYHPETKFTHPRDFFKPNDMPVVAWAAFNDLRKRRDVEKLNLSYPFGTFEADFAMKVRQHYYASVTYIDFLIGKLLNNVNFDDTIIVLVGDHGWSLGEHAEWAKYSNFDVALNVPLIIFDPHSSSKPRHIPEIVELVDIFPTIVHLAGLEHLKKCKKLTKTCTQGKSLVPLMHKMIENHPLEYSAFSQYPRAGLYPSQIPNSDEPRLKNIQIMGYSIRTRQFRYTIWIPFNHETFAADWRTIIAEELYDHSFDAEERENIASRPEISHIKSILFEKLHKKMKQ
ncbi:iduronate 2-sulfatase [Culicoides brevitarsis]|uniref:iduronate 2-sulfatase n=1 Tax=Culicoides brevitarsis TaxID=469753 RepID=UPI00307BCB6C